MFVETFNVAHPQKPKLYIVQDQIDVQNTLGNLYLETKSCHPHNISLAYFQHIQQMLDLICDGSS
jgi:hypothetical protein